MSPIRVGLIGLSTSTDPLAPGMWATTAHLPSILASPNYTLAALCNSTVQSAKASIAHHNLPAFTKAYGSPSDLAQDPDVDLVVVSVQTAKHYMLTKPALLAGKDVFVEWPLGSTTAEATELAELAKTKGLRTMLGLQARPSPVLAKVGELIESGRIGKVMSTTVAATFAQMPVDRWPVDAAYYLDGDGGANILVVQLGHFLDSLTSLLGAPTTLHPLLTTQYPTIALLSRDFSVVKPTHPKTAPDHICLHGTLASDVVYSVSFRSPPSGAVDSKGMHWVITGTEGEIEITTPELQWQLGPPDTTIKIRTKNSAEAEEVGYADVEEAEYVKKLGFPAANTAGLYDAFATGAKGKYADFADAVEMHRTLDRIRGWAA